MGVDGLVQIKHSPRISKEDRRRNQRFQSGLLELVDSVNMEAEVAGQEVQLQTEEISPEKPEAQIVDKPDAKQGPVISSQEAAADATPDERKAMVWTHETGWLSVDEYNLSPRKFERRMRRMRKSPLVRPREKLLRFKAYFSQEDLQILEKVAMARGQQPSDFVRFATLKLFAELGAVGEERKRLLLAFS